LIALRFDRASGGTELKSRMRGPATTRRFGSGIIPGFLFSFFIVGVSINFAQSPADAQSLADIARAKSERRAGDSGRSHVYTNEDLSRPRIVIREDAASASAVSDELLTGQAPSRMVPQTEPQTEPIVWPTDIPLGSIARYYREQRELEAARESRFAVYEPPVINMNDMDFLLPTPLASPLLGFSATDFSATLPAFSSIPEPAWDQFTASAQTVRVLPGDTLWKIAERHLGSGKDWSRIAAENPELSDPNRIQVGQQLRLPAAATSLASSPASIPASSQTLVQVQPGDSLWKLAASQMGSGSAWSCLAAANPQIENVNRIYPGQRIVIPADCPAGV